MNEWNSLRFWLRKIQAPYLFPPQTWWDICQPWIAKIKKYAPFAPDAGIGPDNDSLGLYWDKEKHHIEIDIQYDPDVGWTECVDCFYRNRESGKNWLLILSRNQPLPQDVINHLQLIREAPGEPGKIWYPETSPPSNQELVDLDQ